MNSAHKTGVTDMGRKGMPYYHNSPMCHLVTGNVGVLPYLQIDLMQIDGLILLKCVSSL